MKNRLLIIDSNAAGRENLSQLLAHDYVVGIAHRPRECGLLCAAFKPHVAYFELRSGGPRDALTVCAALNDYQPAIPLIMSVSVNSIEMERLARQKGVFYYLVRPFDARELREAVEGAFIKVNDPPSNRGYASREFDSDSTTHSFTKGGLIHA